MNFLNKRGEIMAAVSGIVALAIILTLAIATFTLDEGNQITGAATYSDVCSNNPYSCIDLNGDGIITYDDEDIFAQLLNNESFRDENPDYVTMADFNYNGDIDNDVDFQQCFVPIRDYYIDFKNRTVLCNPPPENNRTNRTNHSQCVFGCADINGDGRVNLTDSDIMTNESNWNKKANQTSYPVADLDGDGWIDQNDKDCMRPYLGKIVMCNLPVQKNISAQKCPDLTDEFSSGNDGFVDDYDVALFNQYYEDNNMKADMDGDGYIDWFDEYIFDSYYGKIVDCNLYHAPWHTGGIDQANSNISTTDFESIAPGTMVRQSFVPDREGQLTKFRFYMKYEGGNKSDISVKLHPDLSGTDMPNMSVVIAETTIPGFDDNSSHWVSAKFRIPPTIEANKYYHIVLNLSSGSGNYSWYRGTDVVNGSHAYSGNPGPTTGQQDMVFEMFSSTACADFNGDGYVDSIDEEIIESIPDGVSPNGTENWNESYDINDDKIIDQNDVDLIGEDEQGKLFVAESCNSGDVDSITIDGDKARSQRFNASISRLFFINVTLKRRDIEPNSSVNDLKIELRGEDGGEVDLRDEGLLAESTLLKTDIATYHRGYLVSFESGVDLEKNKSYHIRLSSENTDVSDYYIWKASSDSNCYKGTAYNVSTDNYTGVTSSGARDVYFRVYHGNTFDDFNDTLDVNNDSWIDSTDASLVQAAVTSYDPSWWLDLVDFNAIYRLYERLRDKTLGFDAYKEKALKCGLPTYPVYCGNRRCDGTETFESCPEDCPECNNDGFCEESENFTGCGDCDYPPARPRYRKFNGSTTNFSSVDDIGSVDDAVLEIVPYGKIEWKQDNLNFTGLDLDRYVNIGRGWVDVNTTAGDMAYLNKSANITLYNLSLNTPRILVNGDNCTSPQCVILKYPEGNDCDNNCTIVFSVQHFTRYVVLENDNSTQFVNGPIPDIVFDENEDYNISAPSLAHYYFDADTEVLTYGYNTTDSNIKVSFWPNNTMPNITVVNATPFWSGVADIKFNATDGESTAWSNPVTVTVKPNLPPQQVQALPESMVWYEDNNMTLNVSTVFVDGDGDNLEYPYNFIGEQEGEGMNVYVDNDTQMFKFVPDENKNGEWYIVINASDEEYNIAATNYVQLIVKSVNDNPDFGPVINDQVIDEDTNATPIHIDNHFSDVEDDSEGLSLDFELNNTPANFNYSINGTHLMLAPLKDWHGNEKFVVKATDSDEGVTLSNEFTIFVLDVADPLEWTNKSFNLTWEEDTTLIINLTEYMFDPDGSAVYSWKGKTTTNITVYMNQTSGLTRFVPRSNWTGTGWINLTVQDTSGRLWNYTLMNVTDRNDLPEINCTVFYVPEDGYNDTINLSGCVRDIDNSASEIDWDVSDMDNVEIVISNVSKMMNISTNNTDYYGEDEILLIADDGKNTTSAVVKINIKATNDAPVVDLSNLTYTFLPEDSSRDDIDLSPFVSDVDNSYNIINWVCWSNETDVSSEANNNTKKLILSSGNNFTGIANVSCFAEDDAESMDYVYSMDKVFPDNGYDFPARSESDDSGNIYLTGFDNISGSLDSFTMKIDSEGNISWNRHFTGPLNEEGSGIALDSNKNVYSVGKTNSYGNGSYDMLLIKYNNDGDMIWNVTLGDIGVDSGIDIAISDSDEIYVAGSSDSYSGGDTDIWLVRFDVDGNMIWNVTEGSSGEDSATGVELDSEGNVYVTGTTTSSSPQVQWILKYANNGTKMIERSFSLADYEGYSRFAINSRDELYLLGGYSYDGSNNDISLLKYDSEANFVWRKLKDLSDGDYSSSLTIDQSDKIFISMRKHLSSPSMINSSVLVYYPDGEFMKEYVISSGEIATDVSIDSNRNFHYVGRTKGASPDITWFKYDSIDNTLYNDYPLQSNNGSFLVNVTPVDDAPYWVGGDVITWIEDTNKSINLSQKFIEVEGEGMNFSSSFLNEIDIVIDNSTDIAELRPDQDFFGEKNVTFKAVDDSGNSSLRQVILNVTNVNDAPVLAISDKKVQVNSNLNHNVSKDLTDVDSNIFTFYDNVTEFNINQNTGVISWTPATMQNLSVLITACDDSGSINNCTTDEFMIEVHNYTNSTFVNAWVDGVNYNGTYNNVSGVFSSTLNISNVTGTTISVTDAYLFNSVIINSPISNCDIYDSTLEDTSCKDAFIDPSDIRKSDTTGSTIIDSHIDESNATYSRVTRSTIDYSDVDHCNVTDSTLYKTKSENCNISGETIMEGTITYPNGTVYDASSSGDKNLTDIINYPPNALFSSPGSKTVNTVVSITDQSDDPNYGGELEDNVTYSWEFGDGAVSSTNGSVSHTYNSTGTYDILLEITDNYGESDNYTRQITISSPSSGGSPSGGGGGGGSSCNSRWECTPWSSCTGEGIQTRTCNDISGCRRPTSPKPSENQSCSCVEDWICGEWEPEECPPSEQQTRVCEDWNKCAGELLKPDTTRSCDYVYSEPEPTCYDGIRNQGEEKTDCGGPCSPCYVPPKPPVVQAPEPESEPFPWLMIIGIAAGIGGLGAAAYFGSGPVMNMVSPEIRYQKKLEKYITQRLQEGYKERKIVEKLVKEKVPEHIINEALINIKKE